MDVIKIIDVSHTYDHNASDELVLKSINLSFQQGKMYSIMGTSGSGKSTLLNIIGGLIKPSSGQVIIDEQDITTYSERKIGTFRLNNIGFIFQSFNLIPFLNVEENILLPIRILKKDIKIYKEKCNLLLTQLEMISKKNAYISELSGGQQQRVVIARALLNSPKIILADEPTGSLDSKNSEKFMDILTKYCKERNITVLIVTHDNHIASYSDEVIEISDGMISK